MNLMDALPETFPFYHLGKVEALDSASGPLWHESTHDFVGIRFDLSGELNARLFLFFQKDLDLSTYMEVGNILASQTASRYSLGSQKTVHITPPHILSRESLGHLARTYFHAPLRYYSHQLSGQPIQLQSLLVTIRDDETEGGHA